MKPKQIEIKDEVVLKGLMTKRFAPKLVGIIDFVASNYGLVITESFREKRHPGDLHGTDPVRAVDLRTWCYPEGKAEEIATVINELWAYDPDRPDKKVALIHDIGQGIHFHIQVHPNTRRRAA